MYFKTLSSLLFFFLISFYFFHTFYIIRTYTVNAYIKLFFHFFWDVANK